MRAFLKNDSSKKYWEVETEGADQLIRTSKLGPWGRSSGHTCAFTAFPSEAAALADSEKKKAALLKKGWVEFEPKSRFDEVPKLVDVMLASSNDVLVFRRMLASGYTLKAHELGNLAKLGSVDVLKDAAARGVKMPDEVLRGGAHAGDVALVTWALELGLPVDGRDADGETPLMIAAREGSGEIVKLLIERGADASARNTAGLPVLAFAAAAAAIEVIDLVLARNVDTEVTDKKGRTPLAVAAEWAKKATKKQQPEVVAACRHLLAKGCKAEGPLKADLAALGIEAGGAPVAFDESQRSAAIGRWNLVRVSYLDSADDDPDFDGPRDQKADQGFIELAADGTARLQRWASSQAKAGTWKIHRNEIVLTCPSDEPTKLQLAAQEMALHDFDEEHGARFVELFRRA